MGILERLLDLLSRPSYALNEGIRGMEDAQQEQGLFGALDDFAIGAGRGLAGTRKTGFKDVLSEFGMNPESGWTKGLGLAGDVVLDPTNLIGGIGLANEAAKVQDVNKTLGLVGKFGDEATLLRAEHGMEPLMRAASRRVGETGTPPLELPDFHSAFGEPSVGLIRGADNYWADQANVNSYAQRNTDLFNEREDAFRQFGGEDDSLDAYQEAFYEQDAVPDSMLDEAGNEIEPQQYDVEDPADDLQLNDLHINAQGQPDVIRPVTISDEILRARGETVTPGEPGQNLQSLLGMGVRTPREIEEAAARRIEEASANPWSPGSPLVRGSERGHSGTELSPTEAREGLRAVFGNETADAFSDNEVVDAFYDWYYGAGREGSTTSALADTQAMDEALIADDARFSDELSSREPIQNIESFIEHWRARRLRESRQAEQGTGDYNRRIFRTDIMQEEGLDPYRYGYPTEDAEGFMRPRTTQWNETKYLPTAYSEELRGLSPINQEELLDKPMTEFDMVRRMAQRRLYDLENLKRNENLDLSQGQGIYGADDLTRFPHALAAPESFRSPDALAARNIPGIEDIENPFKTQASAFTEKVPGNLLGDAREIQRETLQDVYRGVGSPAEPGMMNPEDLMAHASTRAEEVAEYKELVERVKEAGPASLAPDEISRLKELDEAYGGSTLIPSPEVETKMGEYAAAAQRRLEEDAAKFEEEKIPVLDEGVREAMQPVLNEQYYGINKDNLVRPESPFSESLGKQVAARDLIEELGLDLNEMSDPELVEALESVFGADNPLVDEFMQIFRESLGEVGLLEERIFRGGDILNPELTFEAGSDMFGPAQEMRRQGLNRAEAQDILPLEEGNASVPYPIQDILELLLENLKRRPPEMGGRPVGRGGKAKRKQKVRAY